MSKWIECNKLNKYLKYILFTAIFRYLNLILLGYNYNDGFEEISLLKLFKYFFNSETEADLPNFRMIELFFNYFISLICSFFGRLYELKVTKQNIKYFFNYDGSILLEQKKNLGIKRKIRKSKVVDENILYKFKNYIINNSSFLIYIIISFIWVAHEISMLVFSPLLRDVDFWFFEILIATIIYSKIFLVEIYSHHKFAILLNLIIPCLFKITCIILTMNTKEPMIYNDHPWWIPIGFIIHSLLTCIISFIDCSLKSFFDLKYLTTNMLLLFYSSVGLIVCFFICIISTFVPCCEVNNNDYINTMCKVKDESYKYLESFKLYFNSYSDDDTPSKVIRTFIIILDGITFFIQKYFILLTIKFLDPVHIYFYIPIYYVFQKVILVFNTLIIDHVWIKDPTNYRIAKFFLDIGGDFFCLVGSLIYFEIIQINKCGLNFNVKKNIVIRSLSEEINDNNNKDDEDDYIYNNEDDVDDNRETVIEMQEKVKNTDK